jgi:glutaredoxin-related protein
LRIPLKTVEVLADPGGLPGQQRELQLIFEIYINREIAGCSEIPNELYQNEKQQRMV